MASKKNPKWFYIVLILIPALLIVSLELGLRYFEYGKNLDQWIEITKDKLILNPDIGARYFSNTKNYPHSNHDAFDKIKKKDSFRVFVLGGSTTAGFPFSPNGTFSRYIRDRLKLDLPNKKIEVVNLGITAVNTYTIMDLLPGVLDQQPDLIIIYAGHNEFYGALGVGSTESIGNSGFLIKLNLSLKKYKTYRLISDVIKQISKLLNSKENNSKGKTLMARMAKEQSIKLKSDIFNKGVEQFKNNLDEILNETSKRKVPVLIGTLVSNLKDQKPFISFDENAKENAEIIYKQAKKEYENGNFIKADTLFKLAKDLDGLRFRAPEIFNKIIIELADKYNSTLVDIEKGFSKNSLNGIVGNNLIIDHLHPSLKGYMLMGKLLYEALKSNFLHTNKRVENLALQDSIVIANFAFSKLDRTAANFRILNLLNDWPFVMEKKPNVFKNIILKDRIDTLAYRIVKENYNWEKAHQAAYEYYLKNNDIPNFIKEIKVLVSQYPFKLNYYNFAAKELISRKFYEQAKYFLNERYKIQPDEFSTKWLGNISLINNKIENAIKYLTESSKITPNDPQVFYNLTIAYLKSKKTNDALENIKKCLKLNPNYPNAQNIYKQLSLK